MIEIKRKYQQASQQTEQAAYEMQTVQAMQKIQQVEDIRQSAPVQYEPLPEEQKGRQCGGIEHLREKLEEERAELYHRQHEARKRAEQGKNEILTGLNAGRDIYKLFATACECIGAVTSDPSFTEQATERTRQIYGVILGESQPLRIELEQTEERLEKLRAYASQHKDRNVLQAIREHESAARKIREYLGEAETA